MLSAWDLVKENLVAIIIDNGTNVVTMMEQNDRTRALKGRSHATAAMSQFDIHYIENSG